LIDTSIDVWSLEPKKRGGGGLLELRC